MIVLGVLQNQWFLEPDKVREILERATRLRGPEAARATRRRFCARALFAGCRTGQVLRMTLGDEWCRKIQWENASPEIGGHASSKFPADFVHLRLVLEDVKPDVVLAYGRIASDAMGIVLGTNRIRLDGAGLIIGPHPTARQADTWVRLRNMRDHLDKLQEESVPA